MSNNLCQVLDHRQYNPSIPVAQAGGLRSWPNMMSFSDLESDSIRLNLSPLITAEAGIQKSIAKSMVPKSGNRFSEKIMLNQKARA
jgi:hypothetical protein